MADEEFWVQDHNCATGEVTRRLMTPEEIAYLKEKAAQNAVHDAARAAKAQNR